MFESVYLQAGLIALLAASGLILFVRYPFLKKYIPMLQWFVKTIRMSLDHWNARKVYQSSAQVLERYTILLELYSFSSSSTISRQWFLKFILDTRTRVFETTGDEEEAVRVSNAMFTLLLNHNNLIETLKSLDELKSIDVKRTTLIFIDFLGELFNLNSRVDRLFYEQMIVGINKVLLQLKNGGLDKKTISKVSATAWRMFQLARAYKQSKDLTNLTKAEFEKKMQDALSLLLSYLK